MSLTFRSAAKGISQGIGILLIFIAMMLMALFLLVLIDPLIQAGEPIDKTKARVQRTLFERQGFFGSYGAKFWPCGEKICVEYKPAPLLPFGACDSKGECDKTGELVCGEGKVDTTKTEQKDMATGNQCSGHCKDGTQWIVICSPTTIIDEADPVGVK